MSRRRENDFQKIYKAEGLSQIKYLGVKTIPVERIKGSVNRWREFDQHFRSDKADRSKLDSVMKALERDLILPPITVYKIAESYYIIDGNHRVVAAKLIGQVDIDAEIYELIPPADSSEHILWRERSSFQWKTGLTLDYTEIGAYDRTLLYIRLYAKQLKKKAGYNLTFAEVVKRWSEEIWRPVIELIQLDGLQDCFPGHTLDDLFLYIIHHQLIKSRLQGRGIDVIEAMLDFYNKEGKSEDKLLELFKSFVFKTKCNRLCQNCLKNCPEGLICLEDGRLKIAEECNGCGQCTKDCPEHNPISYTELAADPSHDSIRRAGRNKFIVEE